MFLDYSNFHEDYILNFSDNDKCNFCKYQPKCPLVAVIESKEYVVLRVEDIPTQDFCTLYEPNDRIKRLQKNLNKRLKTKD